MEFLEALQKTEAAGRIPVIPDIKCFSPKEGDLMRGRDPLAYAKELAGAGAPALSVVTEEASFHGSMDLLRAVCKAVSVPVLRKDFIHTTRDLDETAAAGAKAILLMVSCLAPTELEMLYHEAFHRGLLPFIEAHTQEELQVCARLKAPIGGINNRDILSLEKDDGTVARTVSLAPLAGKETFLVAESALADAYDVRTAIRGGARAALVGTALLQAGDPSRLYRAMTCGTGLKICGITDREGVDLCGEAGVDIAGFVVCYPETVPWNLTEEEALPLVDYARGRMTTCVVTGGKPGDVLHLAHGLHPAMIQLHHEETLEETAEITKALHAEKIRVIRSVPPAADARRKMFGTADVKRIVSLLSELSVDGILFDARSARNASRGGALAGGVQSGADNKSSAEPGGAMRDVTDDQQDSRGFYDEIARAAETSRVPVLVGGGITSGNAGRIIKDLAPDYLDVMTGAEVRTGKKDPEKLRGLVAAVKGEGG